VTGRFVVQRHHASTLHFDVRLEIDGVLVSWAVPKGPSTDPRVRRLARRVDDHALSHLDVEGRLGSGTVIVWDTGTYAMRDADSSPAEALAAGHLVVVLDGRKLAGAYALTQTHDDYWLMVKTRDEHAGDPIADDTSTLTGRTNDDYA
jgi:DNA ligase D-like protein (predicted 3'-phosphoesterase)